MKPIGAIARRLLAKMAERAKRRQAAVYELGAAKRIHEDAGQCPPEAGEGPDCQRKHSSSPARLRGLASGFQTGTRQAADTNASDQAQDRTSDEPLMLRVLGE